MHKNEPMDLENAFEVGRSSVGIIMKRRSGGSLYLGIVTELLLQAGGQQLRREVRDLLGHRQRRHRILAVG